MSADINPRGSELPRNSLEFLWLEVTNRCNLECVHCYAEAGPQGFRHDSLSFEEWISILTEARELGCRQVQFIGGAHVI